MEKPFTILARLLRKNSTEVERLLWRHLRDKQFHGLKFKRQQPIDNKYIVDFICLEKRLVIELDGGQHTDQEAKEKDAERDAYLAENGFRILRFWNNEALSNLPGVLQAVRDACSSPHPDPLPQGAREKRTTTEIHKTKDTQGLPRLKDDARAGGQIAGTTRKQIERKLGRSIVSESNFLQGRKEITGGKGRKKD